MSRAGRERIVGVISDTHGLVRPEALAALAGCEHILHAGDIGSPEVIRELETLAPVSAIRGNVDRGEWARAYPETDLVALAGVHAYLVHDLNSLDLDPRAAGVDVVVTGHSHRPRVERLGGVLYLNPGSAGPRRFRLPIALARLRIGAGGLEAEIVDLEATERCGG
jgi:putative phosphoesterase